MYAQKSTIDRFNGTTSAIPPGLSRTTLRERPGLPVPTGMRSVFRVLERVAPTSGGALAERLWFRPPAAPDAAHRERHTPSGGEPFEIRWAAGTVTGRVFGPWGAPTAYLVHGWGGWWQQLSAYVEPLVAAGLCVVAFDAPSHGRSAPGRYGARSTTLVEVAEALEAVVAEFGRPTTIVAHSAGAMAVLHARASGVVADAYVFVAPPDSVAPMMRRFSALLGVGPESSRRMMERAQRRIGLPLVAFDMVAIARSLQNHPPLLVVHDRRDPETPASGSVALTGSWPGSELVLTDGLGHRRVIWEPGVVERVTVFASAAADRVRRSSR
jgi:pimeloyl-ACP methyl ester carboxylesterase